MFAGSPRSFVTPFVHESIRVNLIDALCPPQSCERRIFVRISSSDNIHQGADGRAIKNAHGHTLSLPPSRIRKIEHAVGRLVLDPASAGKELHVRWTSSTAEEEKAEMRMYFDDFRHKIFRELDPRRYSMNFHRWMSYHMARQYETAHGIIFDWVVMARMDMLWGSPIQHISYWSPDKIWFMDRWYTGLPDVFALIPRKFAEAYFSMQNLVQPGVFCLGGPNFDPESLSEQNLRRIGFTSKEIALIPSDTCLNTSISQIIGWSERILNRKLEHGGVTLANCGFSTFFVVVVRYPLHLQCGVLHPQFVMPFLHSSHSFNVGLKSGCKALNHDIRYLSFKNYSSCDRMQLWSKTEYSGKCLLNRNFSDFNFLPFRIMLNPYETFPAKCLTYIDVEDAYYVLKFRPCIDLHVAYDSFRRKNATYKYSTSQLFHFYPFSRLSQFIKFSDDSDPRMMCLGHESITNHIFALMCPSGRRFRIEIQQSSKLEYQIKHNKLEVVMILQPTPRSSSLTLCLTHRNQAAPNVPDIEATPCIKTGPHYSEAQVFSIQRIDADNAQLPSIAAVTQK